jgi:hypothetical protein
MREASALGGPSATLPLGGKRKPLRPCGFGPAGEVNLRLAHHACAAHIVASRRVQAYALLRTVDGASVKCGGSGGGTRFQLR